MLLTTKAKIISDQAKRDKDIEQLALGYLEDTWNAAIEEAARKAFTAIPNGDTAYRVSEEIKGLKK